MRRSAYEARISELEKQLAETHGMGLKSYNLALRKQIEDLERLRADDQAEIARLKADIEALTAPAADTAPLDTQAPSEQGYPVTR